MTSDHLQSPDLDLPQPGWAHRSFFPLMLGRRDVAYPSACTHHLPFPRVLLKCGGSGVGPEVPNFHQALRQCLYSGEPGLTLRV